MSGVDFFFTHMQKPEALRTVNQYRNQSPQLRNANPTCCQTSVAAFHPSVRPPVILQLFDPLRSSTSCFSFANVNKKQKTVVSDARGDRVIPLTEDLSPRKPGLRKRLSVLGWTLAKRLFHITCLPSTT